MRPAPVTLVAADAGFGKSTLVASFLARDGRKGAGDWWEYVLERTYLQGLGEILVRSRGQFAISGTRIAEVDVEAGKTVTLTFTPGKMGRFEIGCHLPTGGTSHYTAGMKGQLIVK